MTDIKKILDRNRKIVDIISDLKEKQVCVPKWEELVKEYDPKQHEIVTDTITRKDKVRKDGIEKVARITYAMQRTSVKRMVQMAFSIPVSREYAHDKKNEELNRIAEAIEAVYQTARINDVNIARMKAFFASCEIATFWYTVEAAHGEYGFDSRFKLRCMTFSPMEKTYSGIEQAALYPLMDANDMYAISYSYVRKEKDKEVEYFETWTDELHIVWKNESGEWEEEKREPVAIGKIPGVYWWRPAPIWEDSTNNVKEIEYTQSRTSDIIRKNAAPIIKVVGKLKEDPNRASDSPREVYEVEDGGDIGYVTWQQQDEVTKSHIRMLKEQISEELQLPNLSIENTKGLGVMSGEARKMLLVDGQLKVGEESGFIISGLIRECNVIKAFLEQLNVAWKEKTALVKVIHAINPFTWNDDGTNIDNAKRAYEGGFASLPTAVEYAGIAKDVDKEVEAILAEQKLRQEEAVLPFAGVSAV